MTTASKSNETEQTPSRKAKKVPVSQNGWPASADPNAIGIKTYRIPGTIRKVRLAQKAAPLLLAYAAEYHKKVEKIDKGQLDDWSYAYRPIRGATVLSNHSSGTALDLNALKHPMGAKGTFTQEQRATIKQLCKKYGLRSGEFYTGRVDGMHVEMDISPLAAKRLIAKLNLGPRGRVQTKTRNFLAGRPKVERKTCPTCHQPLPA